MKKHITLLLLFHCIFAQAQDWQPIHWGEQYNYESCRTFYQWGNATDNQICDHPVWVDSVATNGGDSIFFLNRIWLPNVPENIPQQPDTFFSVAHFLQKQFIKKANGEYWLVSPDTFVLQSQNQQTWAFTPDSSIWASLDTVVWDTALAGILDSIRHISLSSGDTILLSKNYGILQFPHFSGGQPYRLLGIEGSRSVGEAMETWREYFNFDVGDIFVYSSETRDPFYFGGYRSKVTILSKSISADSIVYGVEHIQQGWGMSANTPPWEGNLYVFNSTFHEQGSNVWWEWMATYPYISQYKPFVLFENSHCGDALTYSFYIRDSNNNRNKITADCFLDTTSNPEIFTTDNWGNYFVGLQASFGYTFGRTWCAESTYSIDLTAYYDAATNTTVGNIPSSSYLLGVNELQANEHAAFRCYPNPTATHFRIDGLAVPTQPTELSIYSINGVLMQKQNLADTSLPIDISTLPCGLYLVEIKNGSDRFTQKLSVLR